MEGYRRRLIVPLVMLAVALSVSLLAKDRRCQFTGAISLGLSHPRGSTDEKGAIDQRFGAYASGWGIGSSVGLFFPQTSFEVRLDIGYDKLGVSEGLFWTPPPWDGYVKVYGASAQLLLRLPRERRIVPYLLTGLGPYKVEKYYYDYRPELDIDVHDSYSAVKLGYTIGAGLKLLHDGYWLFFEYRYIKLPPAAYLSRVSLGFAYN